MNKAWHIKKKTQLVFIEGRIKSMESKGKAKVHTKKPEFFKPFQQNCGPSLTTRWCLYRTVGEGEW
jgi:hypothetical protein